MSDEIRLILVAVLGLIALGLLWWGFGSASAPWRNLDRD